MDGLNIIAGSYSGKNLLNYNFIFNMKLLICSLTLPFDSVAHAGGQIHNYYVKRLKRETSIDIHLVTFAGSVAEANMTDLNKYSISNSVIVKANFRIKDRLIRKTTTILNNFFPMITYWGFLSGFEKYLMIRELRILKKNGYKPDIIELNWTQIVFFLHSIKKIFPDAKYYAVEHDVSFLRYWRLYLTETDDNNRKKAKLKYDTIKKVELSILKEFNKIFVLNDKDKMLLLKNGITESLVMTIVPFFKKYCFPLTTERKNTILFYGAMAREENYSAAIWFIENVFPLLHNTELVFTVLGSNPNSELIKYTNDRIIVTGFQPDVQPYFEQALCLVAPLKQGAGIKIKVLEALAAGIPVLGSDVASEGINITHGVDFFHCKTPQEYVDIINTLYNNTDIRMSVSLAAKEMINTNYNFDESFKQYVDTIYSLDNSRKL